MTAGGSSTVLPSHTDPVVRGASNVIGGPVGRRARIGTARWWTPVRVLLALTLLSCTVGFLAKAPCREHPWTADYQYTRLCYTDVFALYYAEHLAAGATPYLDHPVEYPVVIGGLMAAVAAPVSLFGQDPNSAGDERAEGFFDLTTLLLTGCALVVTVTTAALAGRRRVWDAALVALSPLLALHLATNWDLAAMALTGLGLLAWARRRPAVAGLLLGAAGATKLYPLFLLAPLLLLCWRAGRLRAGVIAVATAAGALAALYLPVYLVSPAFAERDGQQVQVAPSPWSVLTGDGSGGVLAALAPHRDGGVNAAWRFVELNSTRPADWDSLWYAAQQVTGDVVPTPTLNLLSGLAFVVGLAGIGWLVARAPRRPRLAQLGFLTLVAFLLTSKVYSPQFSLWLLPLAALARPSWRALLGWQAMELLVVFTRFYFFAGGLGSPKGLPVEWFLAAVTIRDAALLALAALIVRDVLHPEHDPVRADGSDDPAGGVLAFAPDRHPAGRSVPIPGG